MQNVWDRLTEWRLAERQLENLPAGSPEWQLAIEEVDRARSVYRAEVAQATARHREANIAAHHDERSPAPSAALRTSR
jgi:hypothetical protein